jgi:hypothetical protein
MPLISLDQTAGLGLILRLGTGVEIETRSGGTNTLHPCVEGIYVPLRNGPERALAGHFGGSKYGGSGATDGLDMEDADVIDAILQEAGLGAVMRVDRRPHAIAESHEAWVLVTVLGDDRTGGFQDFGPYPRRGVLTWRNSA